MLQSRCAFEHMHASVCVCLLQVRCQCLLTVWILSALVVCKFCERPHLPLSGIMPQKEFPLYSIKPWGWWQDNSLLKDSRSQRMLLPNFPAWVEHRPLRKMNPKSSVLPDLILDCFSAPVTIDLALCMETHSASSKGYLRLQELVTIRLGEGRRVFWWRNQLSHSYVKCKMQRLFLGHTFMTLPYASPTPSLSSKNWLHCRHKQY